MRQPAVDARSLRDFEVHDLECVLGTVEGRRFYYRLVFELGLLEAATFNPSIKDGACQAQHQAHASGRQEAARILKSEAQRHFPELWLLVMKERLDTEQERQARLAKMKAAGVQNDG